MYSFTSVFICVLLLLCNVFAYVVCISLTAYGPQCARLPIPPIATLPSCLWSRRIFHLSPRFSPHDFLSRCKSSILATRQHFTCSRSHAFRYGRQNRKSVFHKNQTHDFPTIIVCVCVCVFIKLHITAQSGLIILVILCHSH